MAATALVLYGVMFGVVFVLRTLIQKRTTGDSGVRAGVLGAAPGSVDWWAGWLLVVALLAGLAAPIAELAGLDPLVDTTWARAGGAVLAAVGIVATFLAQVDMGREWRIGIDESERTGLVADGAFARVRNPIFSAMILTGVGLTALVPNPISLVGVVGLVAAIELQVRFVEEPHLRRLHGDSYLAYAGRVGRFVPGVGTIRT